MSYCGVLPMPERNKMVHLQKHFQKRYCRQCGEYIQLYEIHRHYSRQKMYRYRPKYLDYLKSAEMFYISKTNYRVTFHTPYDVIIVWQNTKASYFSFLHFLNNNKPTRLRYHRNMFFTDIGIISNSKYWLLDEWNSLYPHMYYNNTQFNFSPFTDILWSPNL